MSGPVCPVCGAPAVAERIELEVSGRAFGSNRAVPAVLRCSVDETHGTPAGDPAASCPGCGSTIRGVHKWPPREECRVTRSDQDRTTGGGAAL